MANYTSSHTGAQIDAVVENLFNLVYPVGSIYMSVNNVSPAIMFGGTWEQIQDRFLLAAGSSYTAGSTGGEAEHTLTVDEMPAHEGHLYGNAAATGPAAGEDTYYMPTTSVAKYATTRPYIVRSGNEVVPRGYTRGDDQAHNNMPPYLAVYVWKRTA